MKKSHWKKKVVREKTSKMKRSNKEGRERTGMTKDERRRKRITL